MYCTVLYLKSTLSYGMIRDEQVDLKKCVGYKVPRSHVCFDRAVTYSNRAGCSQAPKYETCSCHLCTFTSFRIVLACLRDLHPVLLSAPWRGRCLRVQHSAHLTDRMSMPSPSMPLLSILLCDCPFVYLYYPTARHPMLTKSCRTWKRCSSTSTASSTGTGRIRYVLPPPSPVANYLVARRVATYLAPHIYNSTYQCYSNI